MKFIQRSKKNGFCGLVLACMALSLGHAVGAAETDSSTTTQRSGSDTSTPSANPSTGSSMGSPASGDRTTPSGSSSGTTSPPAGYVGKPVPPSTAESADSAFKKLALDKNYVTKDDVKEMQGFEAVFDTSDSNSDGRLSLQEFQKAWKAYVASDKANRG